MPEASLVDDEITFSAFSHLLDTRILRALADLGFARPTLVQTKAIPLALEGRDILARARTGSGKTAAYCIPIVQKVLTSKASVTSTDSSRGTRALILVPTRELAEQVTSHLKSLLRYCDKEISCMNIATGTSSQLQKMLLAEQPDILIATPSRALNLLQSKSISLQLMESLIIDEADLILSYGHDEDVRQIINGSYLPKTFQSILMSATMSKDVEELKGLILRSPVILRLEEDEDEAANLSQFYTKCSEVDKFLLTYVILKLKLIQGRCILFVNDVSRSYRLKLFLEQFSVKSCVLNSELPLNSRYHIVQEFNKGVYDYIIATDESSDSLESTHSYENTKSSADDANDLISTQPLRYDAEEDEEEEGAADAEPSRKRKRTLSPRPEGKPRKRKARKGGDREYGVSRGIDFVDVACVINFDLPPSSRAYTHRVGRTARAGRSGMALSYVVKKEEWNKNKNVTIESAEFDEEVFAKIEEEQAGRGSKLKEYKFDMKTVDAFRYRMEDALRAVTRNAIKEARLKELKSEILNSEKLKAHFEDNPLDLDYLRHDKPLHPTRIQSHMKHVPKYLLPMAVKASTANDSDLKQDTFVPFKKHDGRHGSTRGMGKGKGKSNRGGKKSDPLKKFGR